MTTAIHNGNQMTDKERVLAMIEKHINTVDEDLKEAYANFGSSIIAKSDTESVRNYADKCKKYEGQMQGLELAQSLIKSEL